MTGVSIKDLYGYKNTPGDVGIEVEVEFEGAPPEFDERPWKSKPDGSLRNGMEYVTNRPVKDDDTKKDKIAILTSWLKKNHKPLRDSPRTSVHIHANVLHHTPSQVWQVAVAYWMLENAMMKYCGESRIGNQYCLRLKDAEAKIKYCLQDLGDKTPFLKLFSDTNRYSGLNLKAVPTHGSVEYRGMRGTLDEDIIDKWSSAVNTLTLKAKDYASPADLMDKFFYSKDLGEMVYHFIPQISKDITNIKDFKSMIHENMGLVGQIAYATDWSKYEEKSKKVYDKFGEIKRTAHNNYPIPHDDVDNRPGVEHNAQWIVHNDIGMPVEPVALGGNAAARFNDLLRNDPRARR